MTVEHLIQDVRRTLNDLGLGPGQFSEADICEALRLASIEVATNMLLTTNTIELPVPPTRQITIPQGIVRILKVC